MIKYLRLVYTKLARIFGVQKKSHYDFNLSNPLGGNGERVDIQYQTNVNFKKLDIYQKSHWRRYEFARKIIRVNDVCGDFACGTGYGSVMLSDKAGFVTGADLNEEVITKIKERYKNHTNISFLNEDILNLNFKNYFDCIISFETLEHFQESDIFSLLSIFNSALKKNGKLIFSTPYMQEQSEEAIKMGFHLSFFINEAKISKWLKNTGFQIDVLKYQNYRTSKIKDNLSLKEFIICVATKCS